MRKYTLLSIEERIKKSRGLQNMIQSRREQRPNDNKPRTEEEKLILMESSYRNWERDMVKVGKRKWKYVGK
ncbi:hypothetical protein DNHGIG_10580 [Collibacillus ludicampi]|uniref:Uncharacterized protein n=1 Tax=Collibacillus ludicampi TaxID=2771369 RepID=A0AAV4LCE0_9BACL|nr:hypothetical protein DNHGIG_10580 [Collibacillus ludicampi]